MAESTVNLEKLRESREVFNKRNIKIEKNIRKSIDTVTMEANVSNRVSFETSALMPFITA